MMTKILVALTATVLTLPIASFADERPYGVLKCFEPLPTDRPWTYQLGIRIPKQTKTMEIYSAIGDDNRPNTPSEDAHLTELVQEFAQCQKAVLTEQAPGIANSSMRVESMGADLIPGNSKLESAPPIASAAADERQTILPPLHRPLQCLTAISPDLDCHIKVTATRAQGPSDPETGPTWTIKILDVDASDPTMTDQSTRYARCIANSLGLAGPVAGPSVDSGLLYVRGQ